MNAHKSMLTIDIMDLSCYELSLRGIAGSKEFKIYQRQYKGGCGVGSAHLGVGVSHLGFRVRFGNDRHSLLLVGGSFIL